MSTLNVELQLSLKLLPEGYASDELLDELTYQLRGELLEFGLDSVESARTQPAAPGTKAGADPAIIGSLIVGVAIAAVPKFLEVLQAWLMRGQGRVLKIKKVRTNGETLEIEVPADMSPEELRKRIEALSGE